MIDFGYGVALDRIKSTDLPYMIDSRNDYRIRKWCRQYDLLSWQNHLEWFDKIQKDQTVSMYKIKNASGVTVGICGFTDIDRVNQRAEFSLYIYPTKQSQRNGTKALKTLFSHGFLNQNLNLIWGETFDENPALSLFKSLGMTVDGTRPQHYFREGRFIDAHLISLSRDLFFKWKETLWT